MADRPLKALGGKTPLQSANIPNMDEIASGGILGLVKTVSKKTGKNRARGLIFLGDFD